MSPLGRALLGALLGALATLLLHPVSRPFLTIWASRASPTALAKCLDCNTNELSPPRNLREASLWLQLGAQRLVDHQDLRKAECHALIAIADHACEIDRANAFWPQMMASLLQVEGRIPEALSAWNRAANCLVWNDYQTDRLLQARSRLGNLVGSPEAWQWAYVYRERSTACPLIIEKFARTVLGLSEPKTRAGLQNRFRTLMNGQLIRLGARSIATGLHGSAIIELCAYPRDLVRTPTPKRLWLGQSQFLNELAMAGMVEEANNARKAFSGNESWLAIVKAHGPDELYESLSAASVLSIATVSALILVSLIGLFVWSLGKMISHWLTSATKISLPVVIVAGTAMAIVSYQLTHDVAAGIASALAVFFLRVAPKNARQAKPEDLGPLFTFVLLAIASLCAVAIAAFAVARTPASRSLLPSLGFSSGFFTTPLLLGIAILYFSIGLTTVPIWSLVHKLGTPHVLGLALRKFGSYLSIGGLIFAIIVGPIAVFADRRIGQTLMQLVENEPVYYITLHDN